MTTSELLDSYLGQLYQDHTPSRSQIEEVYAEVLHEILYSRGYRLNTGKGLVVDAMAMALDHLDCGEEVSDFISEWEKADEE